MALVTFLCDDMHLEERIKYEVEQKQNLGEVIFYSLQIAFVCQF